jgi:hypothetical protein
MIFMYFREIALPNLTGIPRMNTEQMRMVAAFWVAKKLGPEVGGFSAFQALRIAFAELIWPFPLALDALLLSVALGCMTSNVSRWRWWWLRPQFRDEPQNLLESVRKHQ